ncbi:MAG TPA: phenylalanine--tRNA ligase subunit beta [bacterium]|nr:phenylalanine--tRNA ligase subunit beta [bacterium]
MRVPLEWLREYVTVDVAPEVLAERLAGIGLPAEEIAHVGDDVVLDLEVTANRPDCMSVLGVGREVALLLGQPLRYPDGYPDPRAGGRRGASLVRPGRRASGAAASRRRRTAPMGSDAAGARATAEDRVRVDVEDAVGCPRFTATVIEGVRVGSSPAWMQRRLEAAGVRAINNIVDVTNYVMLETGQPMHAFDYDAVAGHRLVVRRARSGETLETLDEITRVLDDDMLVVADGTRPVSIAGIIGGADTEIGPRTTTVLLEAAYWNPLVIGRAARRLGVRTEAGARFERGADPSGPSRAQMRAAVLLAETSGGRVLPGMVDVYPRPATPKTIRLRPDRAVSVLGVDIAPREMVHILRALGCRVTPGRALAVQAPTFRPDVAVEEDLIEEVIRVYGYDRIPPTLPSGDTTPGSVAPALATDRRVRDVLTRCGLVEAMTLTLVRAAPDARDTAPLVAIANPLTQDHNALRRSLVPGVLEALATNAARRIADAQMFELGRVFLPGAGGGPDERRSLAIAAMGRWRAGWNVPEDQALVDFYHLRWILDTLLAELAVPAHEVAGLRESGEVQRPASAGGGDPPSLSRAGWWHPGRFADVRIGGRPVARCGELHPDLASVHKLPHRAYLAEVDLEALYALAAGRGADSRVSDEMPVPPVPRSLVPARTFTGLPRYPEIERDLAVVLPETVPAGRVEAIIRAAAGPLLEAIDLFDVYTGAPIPPDHRNLAYRLRLRAPDRTLVAEEAEEILQQVRIALRTEAGAQLRE